MMWKMQEWSITGKNHIGALVCKFVFQLSWVLSSKRRLGSCASRGRTGQTHPKKLPRSISRFFLHQNVSPGRRSSWFKTWGGNVHFFHQDAQGDTQREELKKKEISFCSQSVGVNGVTMAPHLKKPAAAGCLTRFPSLTTHHKCIWQRLGFHLMKIQCHDPRPWQKIAQLQERLPLLDFNPHSNPLHSQLHTGANKCKLKQHQNKQSTFPGRRWLGGPMPPSSLPPLAWFTLDRLLRPHVVRLK